MRVRLHDVLLFSAHGTWCPQPGGMERDDHIAVSEVGHEGQISMTMVPADPTFSTPTASTTRRQILTTSLRERFLQVTLGCKTTLNFNPLCSRPRFMGRSTQ